MSLVNDTIFGFKTLEEYDEFIKLLIEIRTPKLSDGKNFKPSIITEIISNSLPPLSDDDLRPVAESIQNMNDTKEGLEQQKKSYDAIEKLKGYYQTYNEAVLHEKAKNYNKINKEWKEKAEEEKRLGLKIEDAKNRLESDRKELEDIGVQIKSNNFTLSELRKDKRFHVQEELENIKKNIEELTRAEAKQQKRIEDKEKEERNQNDKKKLEKTNKEIATDKFNKSEEENAGYAKEIQYDEYFFRMEEVKKNIEKHYDYTVLNQDLKRYAQKIEKGKNAIQEVKAKEIDYDKAQEELDKKRKEEQDKNQDITKDRITLEEEKEKFIEDMYKWESENNLLKFEQEDKVLVSRKINEYGENGSFDNILESARVPYDRAKGKIQTSKLDLEYKKTNLEADKKELLDEIEEWKNKKEAEPVRSKAIQENRDRLREKNIPFAEFYEVVDFKKDLKEEQKDIIENALYEMGILDSIIIEKEDLERVRSEDKEFTQKYLLPQSPKFGHNLLEILDVVIPDDCRINGDTISNILSNIMLDDDLEGTFVDEKGNYKIGLISGKADRLEQAKFIGKEAKRRYKENKILELQKEVETRSSEILKLEEEIQKLEEEISKLEEEWLKFPKKEGLEEKLNSIKININMLASIKKELEVKENNLKEKFTALKNAKEKLDTETQGLYFNKTIEAFQEALDIAGELKDGLYEMQNAHKEICSISEKLKMIKENLGQIVSDLDDLRYDLNKTSLEKRNQEEKKKSLEEMIGTGFDELKEKMSTCLKLEKELPEREKTAIRRQEKTINEKEHSEEKLILVSKEVTELEKINSIYKEILEQELNLKYVISEYDEIGKVTSQILSKYQVYEERNKRVSDYFETLSIKFRDSYEYLAEYNLSIDEMYTDNSYDELKEVPENIRQAYKERNRKDITGFLKGRKVNLMVLADDIKETIEETESLIEDEDRQLFEDILTNTIGRKIRDRIYHAKAWVKSMNNLMENLHTSSGLAFSLRWKPKTATDESEIDTEELVNILSSDGKILKKEEIEKVANHFRSKFSKAEERAKEKSNLIPFYNIMKETLDYRNWFEFEFWSKKGNEAKKRMTNNAFYQLSGGEKAMAMYIPLFAAVFAKYESAREDSPRIISLDEAFAGVDDKNIRDCFRILTDLDLEYIINSQVLWGEYDTIPSLRINELISDPASQVVSVIRYQWNGIKKELVL